MEQGASSDRALMVFVTIAAVAAVILFPQPAAAGAAFVPVVCPALGGPDGGGEGPPLAWEGSSNGVMVARVLEDPCSDCVSTINNAVRERRLNEALASLYRLLLRVAPDLVPKRLKCLQHEMELVETVGEIHENMGRLLSKEIMVRAQYMGWSGDVGPEAGAPVTRSDWLLKDETGWIYVTGGAIPGLSPWRKGDQGTRVEVVGVVVAKCDGRPCVRFKDGRVLGPKQQTGGDRPAC
ncbi:MAG: hypothetical protein NUW12_06345 [Firmicutes bacterium]|nr:hypothetical protein [Bacillota bacterium]MDH7495769.1 hypothetical protein [Bacillota bacterium]